MIRSNPNQAERRCQELVEAEAEAVLDSTEKQDSSGQRAELRVGPEAVLVLVKLRVEEQHLLMRFL